MTTIVTVDIISIYLLLGLLSNFAGPVSRRIKEEFTKTELKMAGYSLADPDVYKNMKRRILPFKVFIRLLVVVFYPIFFIIVILDNLKERNR